MEMELLPWIKDDIAIEIIGKMIAEQVSQLYQVVDELKQAGLSHDSPEVISNPRYVQLMDRIGDFKSEIDRIYDNDNVEEIYKKVDEQYVPHLNKRYTQVMTQSGSVPFFSETEGYGSTKHNDMDIAVLINTSDLNHQLSENKSGQSASISHVNEHH